jgi:glycosyltransferase involved in cell wall biosynthesis
MRIAFLSYQWPGLRMGGIGSYVRQSAAALALAGHEPHVFTVGGPDFFPANVPEGVVLHITPDPARRVISGDLSAELSAVVSSGGEAVYRLAIAWLLTDAFQREHRLQPFDIVEVADVDATGLPLLLGDRTIPVVVHLHTCTAIANRIHKNNLTDQDRLIEAMEAAQIHLADALCAPTDAVVRATNDVARDAGSEVRRRAGSGREKTGSSRISRDLLHSGKEKNHHGDMEGTERRGEEFSFSPSPCPPYLRGESSGSRSEPGASEYLRDRRSPAVIPHPFVCAAAKFNATPMDGPVVFIGRLEWRKGCGVLAQALNGFLSRNPSARFRFVGPDTSSSPDGSSVRLHILNTVDACVRDRVEFTGEVSQAQISEILNSCSFCVLPSLSENFSLAICEAMAARRTSIVAAGTGSVEVLGDAGVVVEPGSPDSLLDAMDSLYRDRSRMNALSRSAFDRVRTLCDPIAVSNQRVDFYQRAIRDFKIEPERLATLPVGVAAAVLPCLARMTAALMQVDEPTDTPGSRLNAIFEKLNDGKPAEVLLYGAGKHTARLLSERHRWERNGHRVVGLIDDHPRFIASPIYLDLPVRSLADASTATRLPAVVLSTDTYEQQFWEQTQSLRDSGVRVFKLYGS